MHVRRTRAEGGRHSYRIQATLTQCAAVVLRAADGEVVVRWSSRHATNGAVDQRWIDERDDLVAELVEAG